MKSIITVFSLMVMFCFLPSHTFAQSRVGITGGMNLSVLTGTVNMGTNLKPSIIRQNFSQSSGQAATCLGGVVDMPVFHHPLTT